MEMIILIALFILSCIFRSQKEVIIDNFSNTIYDTPGENPWSDPNISWKNAYKYNKLVEWLLKNPISFIRDLRHLFSTLELNCYFHIIWLLGFEINSYIITLVLLNICYGGLFSLIYYLSKKF